MTPQRQLWAWVAATIVALLFLVGILLWERRGFKERSATFQQNDPLAGMWNHAPTTTTVMGSSHVPWPRFEGTEMNDLIAYLRQEREGPQREFPIIAGDPERGRELFPKKGCITCHAVKGRGGTLGPDLGLRRGGRAR